MVQPAIPARVGVVALDDSRGLWINVVRGLLWIAEPHEDYGKRQHFVPVEIVELIVRYEPDFRDGERSRSYAKCVDDFFAIKFRRGTAENRNDQRVFGIRSREVYGLAHHGRKP